MKISSTTPHYMNQTYANQANAANQNLKSQKTTDEVANETKADSINFSDRTKDLQKITKAMENDPIDRKKLVADLKQQVETNQYTVNADTVAQRMVGSLMDEVG